MCMEKLQDSQTLPILYLMGTTHYVFLSCIFFLNLQQSTADVYAAVVSELKITRIVLQTHFTSAQIDIWRGASVDHQTAFGKTGPACKKLTTSMFRGKLKMFLWRCLKFDRSSMCTDCTILHRDIKSWDEPVALLGNLENGKGTSDFGVTWVKTVKSSYVLFRHVLWYATSYGSQEMPRVNFDGFCLVQNHSTSAICPGAGRSNLWIHPAAFCTFCVTSPAVQPSQDKAT
jgi:hypothetical protein